MVISDNIATRNQDVFNELVNTLQKIVKKYHKRNQRIFIAVKIILNFCYVAKKIHQLNNQKLNKGNVPIFPQRARGNEKSQNMNDIRKAYED